MKKKTKYITLFIALTITPVVFFYHEIAMIVVFGTDHIFMPDPVKIHLVEGQKTSAEFRVRRGCSYGGGIQFYGEDYDEIKRIFGGRSYHFPASLDIKIVNKSNNKLEFNRIGFGGDLKTSWIGSNPLILIAGRLYLKPGKYVAHIDINKIDKNATMLGTYFYPVHDIKNTCNPPRQ